jgi:molybdopterin converting factor small subunit
MATVYIPTQWRDLTDGISQVPVTGTTLREVTVGLDTKFPGFAARLCDGDGIAAGLAVSIDGAIASRGLRSPVQPGSEIHILPAIGGG